MKKGQFRKPSHRRSDDPRFALATRRLDGTGSRHGRGRFVFVESHCDAIVGLCGIRYISTEPMDVVWDVWISRGAFMEDVLCLNFVDPAT